MADAREAELFDLDTDIGRAYAAVDWSAGPLGPPAQWPESLRATFSLMVSSRFAMWMAWGPQLTFFCNDTYRRDTLGVKYPWALGRPATEVWAEIWPDVGPLVDGVLAGDGATWDEGLLLFLQRSGFVEETYHTFSYSPLTGDDGAIAGMFCVVSEDTDRVLGQRRIGALSDLASGLSIASSSTEIFAAAEARLANDPYDLPFVAGYLLEPSDQGHPVARLAFRSGIPAGHDVAPASFVPGDSSTPWAQNWPVDDTPHVVEGLPELFDDLPTGAWSQPPTRAVITALRTSGEHTRIAGALVVGMNPHRAVDDHAVEFVTLVADQLAAAVARGRAFDAERERVAQMAELDRAKTTFFTNVSHEVRTPLTLLLGPVEDALADTSSPLDAAQRRRIEVVHRNAERLLKLVNTLLDFSRLESGRTQAIFEPIPLDRFTAELVSMFDSAFDRAGLMITVDCAPLPEPFFVDREMWSKIVLNLMSNALKATFTGGVTVQLTSTTDGAALSVGDTGVGIEPDQQARLFERFHRVSGARLRTHEGSGIGLALVAELVALHGGAVSVVSTPGEGSTFTVTVPAGSAHLPADQVVAAGHGSAQTTSAALGAGYLAEAARWVETNPRPPDEPGHDIAAADSEMRLPGRRILVVDDNADMREYVSDVLAGEYLVETASDGAAGLAQAIADPPDLILTDVMMPVLDGFGLLKALRGEPTTAHIPVVMLSARSGEEAAVEGLEAGADDYLVKPFSQRELRARVRTNLEYDRVHRVADELARSREMLAHAEELAQVGSFEYDVETDSLRGTAQFFALTGIDAVTARERGERITIESISSGDRQRVRAAIGDSVADGADLDLEFGVGAGAGARLLWLRAVVDQDSDGAASQLRGSVQDITARAAAQAAAEAVAAAREVAAREHEIAHELQQSLLPQRTLQADHLDLAAFYRAGVEGTQVGGDWYDVIELDAGRTAFVLGDVMGRGIQAATVMGQLRATVRAYARIELAPDVLMQLLDDAVRDIRPDMIVTCVYAVYDPTDQSFTYANAGHLPPLLVLPGEPVRRLTEGGPPLGTQQGWSSPETITLPTGAMLALYTDGLVERRGLDVGERIDLLAALLGSAPEDIDAIPAYLTEALLPGGPDDDVALLVARVSDRATDDRVMVMAVPDDVVEVGPARDRAAACITEWGGDDALAEDVRLIVSELVTNAVLHGEPPVQLRVRKGGRRLLIEVYDSAVSSPQLRRAAPNDNHGRGLLIVSMLSQRWGTRPTPSGKSVWCQLSC
ncbi:SpoIIE family protein phosphatase [uncultured Jatrophihabitans sp.]|uniref:SpoIIE family protein phosphatase n=1 Tax=uncultured Jatrophihabitans sp. TaxID=1610747 RepID=UPI0035C97CE7